MSEPMTSYCKMHNTHPADNEPCWQCINKFGKADCHDELVAACEQLLKEIEELVWQEYEVAPGADEETKGAKLGRAALAKAKKLNKENNDK